MTNLETYGDLKKLIRGISKKQKGEKIISKGKEFALDQVLGLIPGASNAKTMFDFVKTAISKPVTKKTNTWLDKLDIDDAMSAIVDDTVENGFFQYMSKSLEQIGDDVKLQDDFDMNVHMVNYLKNNYKGRTISGIQKEGKNESTNNFDLKLTSISKILFILLIDITILISISSTNDFNIDNSLSVNKLYSLL
jgi:hypothetical protein